MWLKNYGSMKYVIENDFEKKKKILENEAQIGTIFHYLENRSIYTR